MKLLRAALIVIAISLLLGTTAYGVEAFEINSYDIKMNVKDNNSYEITEKISVTYSAQRHGIMRTIPLKTYNGNWASIKNVKVAGQKYELSRENGELIIKIGDPNKFAKTKEVYEISYLFDIGDDRITGMDELYLNLIGTDWDTYISNVTFEIRMPFAFDKSKLNFTYGPKGSRENSKVQYSVAGNLIKGKLDYRLGPKEALTVALPLPEGYFVNVKKQMGFEDIIYKYYGYMFPGLTLAAIILWYIFGRNRRIFPTVEFYAPYGMTSADVGYVSDGRVDPYDITSLIIYWADKGYLRITESTRKSGFVKKKFFILTKLRELGPEAKDYEREMFTKLFSLYGNSGYVTTEQLKNYFYSTVNNVKAMILRLYTANKETRIYARSGPLTGFLIKILSYASSFITMYGLYNRIVNEPFEKLSVISLAAGGIMIVPLWLLADLIHKWKTFMPGKRAFMAVKRLFFNILILAGAMYFAGIHSQTLLVAAGYVTCFVILLISMNCTKRTPLGDKYMEKILGFKEFLLYAEKDRINMLVNENSQYFYNVLPFAMVLGVTDKWARKFEHIAISPPAWYQTDRHYDTFNTVAFVGSINESMSHLVSSMTSKPSSSSGGSSDGGSSGGGSGGGGGSSW